jgi:hypothetical protein
MHVLLNIEEQEDWSNWIDKRSKMMVEDDSLGRCLVGDPWMVGERG